MSAPNGHNTKLARPGESPKQGELMAKKPVLWRKTTATVAMFAAAALTLTACGTAAGPGDADRGPVGDPVTGGTLTVAINDDPRSIDAIALPGVTAAHVSEMVFE